MSALADELHSVLSAFRNTMATEVNQGLTVTIDGHLARLEAAAADIGRSADDEVHRILGDLYTAFHAPVAEAPAAPAPEAPAALPADPAPEPLATGGTIAAPAPAIVGEPGPELVPPTAAAVPAAPAADPEPAAAEAPATETPASL